MSAFSHSSSAGSHDPSRSPSYPWARILLVCGVHFAQEILTFRLVSSVGALRLKVRHRDTTTYNLCFHATVGAPAMQTGNAKQRWAGIARSWDVLDINAPCFEARNFAIPAITQQSCNARCIPFGNMLWQQLSTIALPAAYIHPHGTCPTYGRQ